MPRLRSFPAPLFLALACLTPAALSAAVDITVNPDTGRAPISPYIYGTNADIPGVKAPLRRQGGNRMTGYNWETNASNAGQDYLHQSDNYLLYANGLSDTQGQTPAIVVTQFHDQSLAAGAPYSVVTVPMAGYVAADMNGPVTLAQVAPSSRWHEQLTTKPTALSLTPDLTDGKVYTDEYLNFLKNKYGPATGATGIRGYNLDNEPDLWSGGKTVDGAVALTDNGTHPLLHPAAVTCAELIARSTATAQAIKRVDPTAEVFGFVSYGFQGWNQLQAAPDWTAAKAAGGYRWFLDYYLDHMKGASTAAGTRLVDILDLHYYTEAIGGGLRVTDTSDWTNLECNKARLQAPRSLWDPTYFENSWLGQYQKAFLPFLPNIRTSIASYDAGAKLAFTEYYFGGEGHVSGGLVHADVLGLFGQQGVYAAAIWPFRTERAYLRAAFNLYLDYDGAGARFGNTAVSVTHSDPATCSVYASIEDANTGRLHVIVLNKSYDTPTPVNFTLNGATTYTRARVFAFDAASAAITERAALAALAGNRATYTLPALTGAHFVFESAQPPAIVAAPAAHRVALGRSTTFQVEATGADLTYQWLKDGTPLAGATEPILLLSAVTDAAAGAYSVVVTNPLGSATSPAAGLTVAAPADPGRLVNLSILAHSGTGADVLIAGFVTGGAGTSGTKTMLLRGVGPALTTLGVTSGYLADPTLKIDTFAGPAPAVATNDDWAGAADVAALAPVLGAFAFPSSASKDAALTARLNGVYTMQIAGKDQGTGLTLAEVYDGEVAAHTATSPRLLNVSARGQAGSSTLTAGFVIGGSTSMTLLLRGLGPWLTQQGLPGAIANPRLELVRIDGGARTLAISDDWNLSATIAEAARQVGAQPLTSPAEAALLLTLEPGVYTVSVSNVAGASGQALAEVYELP